MKVPVKKLQLSEVSHSFAWRLVVVDGEVIWLGDLSSGKENARVQGKFPAAFGFGKLVKTGGW